MNFSQYMAKGTGGEPLSMEVAFEGGKVCGREECQPKIDKLEKKLMALEELLKRDDVAGEIKRTIKEILDGVDMTRFVNINKVQDLFHGMEIGLNKLSGEGLITKK